MRLPPQLETPCGMASAQHRRVFETPKEAHVELRKNRKKQISIVMSPYLSAVGGQYHHEAVVGRAGVVEEGVQRVPCVLRHVRAGSLAQKRFGLIDEQQKPSVVS